MCVGLRLRARLRSVQPSQCNRLLKFRERERGRATKNENNWNEKRAAFLLQVFPDAIFFILVVSQWFLAGWSVVGAALYFRLFNGNRTCSRECFCTSSLNHALDTAALVHV